MIKNISVLLFLTLMIFAVFSDQKPDNLRNLGLRISKCIKHQMKFTDSERRATRVCQYLIRR